MEALVITLREGVEAALIVGLILAYLTRSGREGLRRWVYAGLGLAIVSSIIGAAIFYAFGYDPDNPMLEGILLGVAAIMVVTLVYWMWRSSRSMKSEVEGKLDTLTAEADSQGRAWGLLAFAFFMVFREGIEIILFLAALSLTSTSDYTSILGGLAGLTLAILFGVLFVKGSLRINLGRFFLITGLVLMALAVRLAAGSIHEFFEIGVLPEIAVLETVTEFLVTDLMSRIILIAVIALPVLTMLPEIRIKPDVLAARPGESAPERTARVKALRRSRRWQFALVGVTLATVLIIGITPVAASSEEHGGNSENAPVEQSILGMNYLF